MLRFLIRFLLLAIVLVGGGMLLAQWKLEKEIKNFSNSVRPFMDFDYDSTSLSFNGEMKINGISIFIEKAGVHIDIGELNFFIGNLYELATLKSNFLKKKLPEEARLKLKDVLIPFDSKMMVQLDKKIPVSSIDVLQTAFCGDVERFGLDELGEMGYSYVSFTSETSYLLDKYSGNLVLSGSVDAEDMSLTEFQINISGVLSWLEEIEDKMLGIKDGAFISPDLSLLEVRMLDKGYNLRKAEYCNRKQNAKIDYYTGHTDAVKVLSEAVGMPFPDDVKALYLQSLQPDAKLSLLMQPTVSFDINNMGIYKYDQFVESSGLKMSVNDKPMTLFVEGWSFENFDKLLKFAKLKKEAELGPQERYRLVTIPQSFQKINPSSVTQYLDYRSKITRDDGQMYEGKIVRINERTVWTIIRGVTGEVTIPINRNRISRIEIYKPTPK